MRAMTSFNHSGPAGEQLCLIDLSERGVPAYHNAFGGMVDILAIVNGETVRIQVKGAVKLDEETYQFYAGSGRKFEAYIGEADILALAALPCRRVLYIPLVPDIYFMRQESVRIVQGRFNQPSSDLSWSNATDTA